MRRLNISLFALAVIFLPAAVTHAQPAPASAQPTRFDAISLRPSTQGNAATSEGGPGTDSPTLFRLHSASLQDLIAKAWNVDAFQITSAAPLDTKRYDVEAKLPQGTTEEQLRTMLQSALASRFGLKARVEQKEFPVYQLVVAQSGLKLKDAATAQPDAFQGAASGGPCGDAGWPDVPPNTPSIEIKHTSKAGSQLDCMTMQRQTLSALAQALPKQDDLPIVDKTGLAGRYSLHLEYAPEPPESGADVTLTAADLPTALKDQLGLDLHKATLPLKVVVVEAINKQPTTD